MKRWLIPLIVIAILVGGFFVLQAYRQSRQETSLSALQTVEAAYGPLTATVGATGSVRANQFATLTFQTSGTVEKVSAALGDYVQAGDVLAEFGVPPSPQSATMWQGEGDGVRTKPLQPRDHSEWIRAKMAELAKKGRDKAEGSTEA